MNSHPEIIPKIVLQAYPNLGDRGKFELGKTFLFWSFFFDSFLDLERTIYLENYDTKLLLSRIAKVDGIKHKLMQVVSISWHLFCF